MRLNRPQGVATNSVRTAGVARRRNRLGAGAIRVLSVTAVAAATCSLWAGAGVRLDRTHDQARNEDQCVGQPQEGFCRFEM